MFPVFKEWLGAQGGGREVSKGRVVGRGQRGSLCFAVKTQEMRKKSLEGLFENGSLLGAVREVGNGSGRVCWLPHPQLQKHLR